MLWRLPAQVHSHSYCFPSEVGDLVGISAQKMAWLLVNAEGVLAGSACGAGWGVRMWTPRYHMPGLSLSDHCSQCNSLACHFSPSTSPVVLTSWISLEHVHFCPSPLSPPQRKPGQLQ